MTTGILAPNLVDQRQLEVRRVLDQQAKSPWTGLAVVVCEFRHCRTITITEREAIAFRVSVAIDEASDPEDLENLIQIRKAVLTEAAVPVLVIGVDEVALESARAS